MFATATIHGMNILILLMALVVPVMALPPMWSGSPEPAETASPISVQASSVSAGRYHTCALTTSGGVKCWGYNGHGELGDGTTTQSPTPVDVVGLSGSVIALSAGSYHTCALTVGGGLQCWGLNQYGQLGDGTSGSGHYSPTPVDVVGLSGSVGAVSAGNSHTCALMEGGGVKCWGRNADGPLGDGTTTDSSVPVSVVDLSSDVPMVDAGDDYTCVVTAGGGAKCWGDNDEGQLGDGTRETRFTPVDVVGLGSVVATVDAGAGRHTCAVTADGAAKCWGDNARGQLGDSTTTDRTTPVDVVGLGSGVGAISAGNSHTCALTEGGGVKCWGANNLGQLGDSTATDRTTPVNVTWLSGGVAVISAGYEHTGALTVGGGVKSWGFNNRGQLGDGTTTNSNTAVDVVGLEGSVLVSTSPAVTGLELAWLHMDFSVEHYEVYRQTTPFFEPGGPDSVKLSPDVPAPTSGTAIEVTFEDAADLTIPGASYYYAVVPVNESGESFATSNPTGAFVYDLMPGGVARR